LEIHKPKPWHGFREFLKEYVIIVVGVLTALAGEQVVETLHWRHVAEQAREDLAADYRRTLRNIGAQDAAAPCARHRLEELRGILDKGEADGRLPTLPSIDQPPGFAWTFGGWDGLVSSQALAHLPRGEGARYSSQASYATYLAKMRDAEREDWSVIASMAGPARALSHEEAAHLRATLAKAMADDTWLRLNADNLGRLIYDTHLLTPSEVQKWWKRGVASLPNRPFGNICRPLSQGGGPSVADQLSAPLEPPTRPYTTTDYYARHE